MVLCMGPSNEGMARPEDVKVPALGGKLVERAYNYIHQVFEFLFKGTPVQ